MKLFGTDGVRGKAGSYPMDEKTLERLGQALRQFLLTSNRKNTVFIGRDTRDSGTLLEQALLTGLKHSSIQIKLLGIIPTPGLSYLTKKYQADLGIMISASHNPSEDNGVKLLDETGSKFSKEREGEIEAFFFQEKQEEPITTGTATTNTELSQEYKNFLLEQTPKGLSSFKIILDCAHGAFFKIAPDIFKSQNLNFKALHTSPNGQNINENCGVLHPEALSKAVLEEKADLGFSFDGDGDRLVVVDEKGKTLDGDNILAILSSHFSEKTVIGTIMSNSGLEKTLRSQGIKFLRSTVGDREVLSLLQKEKASLGGEPSGHILYLKKAPTSDAILTAFQLLEALISSGKSLNSLTKTFTKHPQITTSIPVKEKVPLEKLPSFKKELEKAKKQLENKGRVLFRYSGTENLARLMLEGESEEELKKLMEKLSSSLKKDLS